MAGREARFDDVAAWADEVVMTQRWYHYAAGAILPSRRSPFDRLGAGLDSTTLATYGQPTPPYLRPCQFSPDWGQ